MTQVDGTTVQHRRVEGGDHWWTRCADGLVIYGRVDAFEEFEAGTCLGQQQSWADIPDAPDLEPYVQEDIQRARSMYARGLRPGRCYSTACPKGEWGWQRVDELTPITAAQFEAAKAASWPS